MKRPERWVEAGARIEGRNEAVRSGVESINICRGGPVSDRYVANSAFAQQRIQHSLLSLGEKPRRGFWPRDAFHAVLSVRVAFSDPWRSSDLVDRLAVDRQAVMPGSRRFPPPWSIDEGTGNSSSATRHSPGRRLGSPKRGENAPGAKGSGVRGTPRGTGGLLPQSQLKHMLRSVGI